MRFTFAKTMRRREEIFITDEIMSVKEGIVNRKA